MSSKFSIEEKRQFMFKKHIKDHLFEYILDFIGPILLTILILYICHSEDFLPGILISTVYSLVKLIYTLYHYKKEYIDNDIK